VSTPSPSPTPLLRPLHPSPTPLPYTPPLHTCCVPYTFAAWPTPGVLHLACYTWRVTPGMLQCITGTGSVHVASGWPLRPRCPHCAWRRQVQGLQQEREPAPTCTRRRRRCVVLCVCDCRDHQGRWCFRLVPVRTALDLLVPCRIFRQGRIVCCVCVCVWAISVPMLLCTVCVGWLRAR
jgi:hypothetical protein